MAHGVDRDTHERDTHEPQTELSLASVPEGWVGWVSLRCLSCPGCDGDGQLVKYVRLSDGRFQVVDRISKPPARS
jgi:hypothetical protein